ncbi:unnamed protein product [Linum trigynum]|uniref:Uncharacterized protein n=1 Tax=Linum trigynum TaxID=586398 RepID=A0AAV2CHZ3_9ROSI
MEEFCSSSGQRVNLQKSLIFVSPNVPRNTTAAYNNRAEIPLTSDIGRYLGVMAINSRVTKDRYRELILKVQKKLSSWKAKKLSLAARLTVVRSVSTSIPVYSMQIEMFPSSVCKEIDKFNRNFLWGDTKDKKHSHLVGWKKLLEQKENGGAGLRSLRHSNTTLLEKSGWRVLQEKDTLWTQVVRGKYGRNREGLSILEGKHGSSFTWKSITKANPILRKGCAWNISNGKNTKFWTDIWALQVPLKDVAVSPISEMEAQKPVAAYMNDDGQWLVELFQQWLPTNVMDKITTIATDLLSTEEDRLCWQPTSTGDFTAKSAYRIC